jgi:ATP-binding cassette subfamily B (MDR/TAP) protein 6
MVCILVGRVASPVQPIILGRVVNQLIAAQNGLPARPLVPFAEYIGVRLSLGSSGLLTFINNVLWVRVAQYTDREMQMLCFNHLLNLSLAYHTKRNTGEVLKIIDRGSAINNLFQTLLFTAIPTVLDIIISFGVFYVSLVKPR